MDLLKDFSLIRDSKSTKFPHGFMAELDTRITGVLMGRERMPEFNDARVKRTFAVFLNAFKEKTFRKNMETDRRVEDLLLIFFSNATKELQKGKASDDDAWKLMVDRHVALFIRLISSILKDHDWNKERPELATRLQTLEKKLLIHDQDLSAESQRNGGAGGSTVEVEIPRSYAVKDMPLVQTVQRIFGKDYDDVQADIIAYRPIWTEKAALQDLKLYQANLSLKNKKTLSSEDFDSEEAYEVWKKAEIPDISQMMLAIVQSNMELAKETTTSSLPQFRPANGTSSTSSPNEDFSELSRRMTNPDNANSYVLDQPVDMSGYSPIEGHSNGNGFAKDDPYTYIPPDPRTYYRMILKEALTFDLRDTELQPSEATFETPAIKLLSKQSTELLSEVALRWRLPQFSRPVLFLDVIREKYTHEEISLDTLDAAFIFVKEPQHQLDVKKSGNRMSMAISSLQDSLFDWHKWTVTDYALHVSTYTALRDCLLRDLFGLMLFVYDSKPPDLGPVMYILNEHINADPIFSEQAEPPPQYQEELQAALSVRAFEVYQEMVKKQIPDSREECEFYHVIQLGKAVVKLCEKIQKRYRKNPRILGVDPLMTLVSEMLPGYAEDAKHLVNQIIEVEAARGDVVPVQDGFDLYREMVEIRGVHANALPGTPFRFDVEEQLQDFVWRYIAEVDSTIVSWVEEAVKQDTFQVRTQSPQQIPTDDERHSDSIIDIFRSFNQSVETIIQLNWDNDVHYAKFMTAISKSISMGICRYGELLEQKFAREMDRLTPEQEAAKAATRQEKWMQMAKDAWANQPKIEPFQFAAESLVKLNNIEWATRQMDAMSINVNVDACADVIERNTPAQVLQQRLKGKNEKFVFTIKIIEAEDLKACDMNGLSDPYVVLGDEYQKRLAKTRVIYSNLNPRWDESVDITTSGALNIIATIWDHDTLGDHDCVGRTNLKLDPSHSRDYVPREYWLDLDTQGRLLLRVSMEGERDDIRFWFGKGMRGLKRTEREMTRGIVDKLSAYIHHCLSKGALKRLLNKNYAEQVSAVKSWFQSRTASARTSIQFNLTSPPGAMPPARQSTLVNPTKAPTVQEIEGALKGLFAYFDENFAIMKETLTETAMIAVMTRVWKEVLSTLESLMVPPLSDKPSGQKPLNRIECDVVFRWLEVSVAHSPFTHLNRTCANATQLLLQFFHAIDEETKVANGIPMDVLKSPKYHDLCNLAFFYFEDTDALIRQSEFMASASVQRQQETVARMNRLSAPAAGFGFGGLGGQYGLPSTRRSKSIMMGRNLGTMRRAKEEKRKEAQAEPSDDMILRILRMRPEAERYLKDRSRQKERLQAAAAAEQIVRMSLAQSQGMAGGGGGGGGLQRGLPRR